MKTNLLAPQLLAGFVSGLVLVVLTVPQVAPHLGLRNSTPSKDGEPRPVAIIRSGEWNCGQLAAGQTALARFEVENAGDRRLILRRLNGTCDCLSTPDSQVIIEPGQRRTLVARLDTAEASGTLEIELNYRTSDPERPLLTFLCHADVTRPAAQPERP